VFYFSSFWIRGIAERVQPVESEEVVQGKIETGVAEWELLQLSMSKFGNIQHVPQVAATEADGKKRTVDVKAASALIAELIDSKVRKESAAHTATIAQEVDGVAKQVDNNVLIEEFCRPNLHYYSVFELCRLKNLPVLF
jgi:hypothetical protein